MTRKLISSACANLGHNSFHYLEFTMLGFLLELIPFSQISKNIKYDILTDFSKTFGFRDRSV
ncbi:Uncharacterized protein APZ42_015721 [Daphnia magna]|uniref:Uncharacterized protein n=1 Tax=Daphnia magna TaxID=35525 RepID=A0A162NQ58_9CRUS|nr:Uncharacterized protein APZ42_015721 [Daphnia magna]